MTKKIFNSATVEQAKRKFGFDPNSVTNVPKMTSDEVITELQESSNLLQKIRFDTGIKNKGIVPIMRGDFPLNAWDDCTMANDADVVFDEIEITTTPLGFAESFCSRTLVPHWTAMGLATGLLNEMKEMPFETQVSLIAIAALRANIENLMVNGDTGSVNPNLVHFDGYAKLIRVAALGSATYKPATYTGTAITAATAYANFKGVARAFPAKVLESSKTKAIWCNAKMFDFLTDNLETNNNFHYSAQVNGEGDDRWLILPSTGVRVEVRRGLSDNAIFGVVYENLVAGTDASEDMANVEYTLLPESRKTRLEAGLYLGVALAFPEEFVYFAVGQ